MFTCGVPKCSDCVQNIAFAQCLQHQELLQQQCMQDLAVSLGVYVALLKLAKLAFWVANSVVLQAGSVLASSMPIHCCMHVMLEIES